SSWANGNTRSEASFAPHDRSIPEKIAPSPAFMRIPPAQNIGAVTGRLVVVGRAQTPDSESSEARSRPQPPRFSLASVTQPATVDYEFRPATPHMVKSRQGLPQRGPQPQIGPCPLKRRQSGAAAALAAAELVDGHDAIPRPNDAELA